MYLEPGKPIMTIIRGYVLHGVPSVGFTKDPFVNVSIGRNICKCTFLFLWITFIYDKCHRAPPVKYEGGIPWVANVLVMLKSWEMMEQKKLIW